MFADSRFCDGCGAPVEGASPVRPERDPRSCTPKQKSALEGERKQVTVLFADVKGSMGLAERLDPQGRHDLKWRRTAVGDCCGTLAVDTAALQEGADGSREME